ncbi:TPA: hypothetical protein HA351_09290 [Methanosarcinaceae archaeon]|nr:hypothetical protein [Methanosarcinaceae archaeon]
MFSLFYLISTKYLLFQLYNKLPEVPEFFKLRLLELLRWLVKSKGSGAQRTGSRKEKVEGERSTGDEKEKGGEKVEGEWNKGDEKEKGRKWLYFVADEGEESFC